MVYNAEKNLTPLYVSKKFYHQIEVWEKSFLHKPNHPYTSPLPPPPRTSNGPAPIQVIQVIKHYPVQKILPVYTIPLSTESHKPLDSGCKKYPRPPHPPRVDWNVQLPRETPATCKLKVFRNVTQSVGCLFVVECKEKPSQTFTSPFPLKV